MDIQERKYQEDCLDAIHQAYLEGCYQQLIVAATGTGKAVIIGRLYGKMAHLFGGKPKMLVFAHREQLIKQLVKTMQGVNPELRIGKEMAEHYADVNCDIVVSCVQSIGRDGATRLARFGNFDIVICDEAHHSIASTYLNVFEATGVLRPDSKRLLAGFTATPKRKNLNRKEKKQVKTLDDEQILQLSSVYKKIVFTYPIRKAIKEGWLSRLKGFRVTTETSLDNVKVTAGEFQKDELQETINTPARNQQIVKAWLDNMEGRKSVGFTAGIQHAKDLAEMFRKHGVQAEAIWGVDPEQEAKIKRHADGTTLILFNAQLLVEGYDDWTVRCIILAAPTASSTVYTQEVGRGTRIQEGIGNLNEAIVAGFALSKIDCYILDVVDNYKRCHLPTLPSLLGLSPDLDLQGTDVVEAAEIIEALQDKYPGIDFTGLVDIKNVKAYVESIDMFANPYTEDVKAFSKLAWMATSEGYILAIPEKREIQGQYYLYLHERLSITTNELEQFELGIKSTETERTLGVYSTLQGAFASGDDVVARCRADRMRLLVRDAPWHTGPASEAAKKYLRKLTKKKPIFLCLCENSLPVDKTCATCGKNGGITAGQAALALNILKAK